MFNPHPARPAPPVLKPLRPIAELRKDYRELGARLLHVRRYLIGASQQALADHLHVARSAIANWEAMRRPGSAIYSLPIDILIQIAHLGGVPCGVFLPPFPSLTGRALARYHQGKARELGVPKDVQRMQAEIKALKTGRVKTTRGIPAAHRRKLPPGLDPDELL